MGIRKVVSSEWRALLHSGTGSWEEEELGAMLSVKKTGHWTPDSPAKRPRANC